MKSLRHWLGWSITWCALLLLGRAETELSRGDVLPAFTVMDAKGAEFRYEPGKLRHLLVSYAMSPGKVANTYFASQPANFLETKGAAFLADIHGMPQIGRVFALPKMRKYPHRVLLADSETLLTRHPKRDGCLTVFTFDAQGAISDVRQIDPEKELAPWLAAQPSVSGLP